MKALLLLATMMLTITSFAANRRYRLMFNTDPSTSITIGWEQQSGTNPIVHYGTVDQGTNYTLYPNTHGVDRSVTYQGMNNRFARITGLTPNTVYYFVIHDSEGTSQRFWFTTCPNTNTETLSLITGGDSRSGTTQRQNSNRMVADIRPHAVLFGGDLMNTPGDAATQEWLDDWQLTTTTDGQMIPVVHSFGNHEQYGTGGPAYIDNLFDTGYDVYYNIRFGGDLFSMYTLNGEVLPGHTIPNNTVRVAQRNWLNTTLQADPSIWKGAQYHRPIVPHEASKGEGADEFYDWANLFYEYGVRVVMESDAHVTKLCEEVKPSFLGVPHTSASGSSSNWFVPTVPGVDDPEKGITFIGEGAWGTIRVPDDLHPFTMAATDIYQFNWMIVTACSIEIRTIDTQSPGTVPQHAFGDYTSISAGLEAQIWKPSALPTGILLIERCNPPVANFVADQTNIFTGTTVNFTDLSTNTPTSWTWDFGDGSPTSSVQNPSHAYNTPGSYNVTLTATNADGSDIHTKLNYIVVVAPQPPTANFVADITTAAVSQTINFTDLSTGVPTSWLWDFGDGIGTSSAQNPSYSYGAPGTYTVTLTATNVYGSDDEIKIDYIVVVNGASVCVAVINGNDDVEEFNSDGSLYTNSSDLELCYDGGNAENQYVGIRFQNVSVPQGATISNAYLTVRADETDNTSLDIYVYGDDSDNSAVWAGSYAVSSRPATTATYTWVNGGGAWTSNNIYQTGDLSAILQEIVNRPGWSSGNSMSLIFHDNGTDQDERVADPYEGSYPPELCFDYVMPLVAAPVANFSAASTSECEGTSITFTDLSTNSPVAWSWSITGAATLNSTQQNPTFNFTTPGTYTVELTATNAGGSDAHTQSNMITIHANPAAPTISASGATTFCTGGSVTLTSSQGSGNTWSTSATTPFINTASSGSYTVTYTDGNGCSATSTPTAITVNPLPSTPTVSAGGATTFCAGGSVTLTSSQGSGNLWSNSASTPAVNVTSSGSYSVTYTDVNGCQATSTPTVVTVNALPATPTISAGGATTFCSGGSVTLTSSQGSGNLWSTSASTAAINVTSSGSYSVTYTDGNGCQATSTPTVVTVNALPSTPTISAGGATTFCSGGSVTLTSSQGSNNLWSTSASTPAINVASSGSYSVTYTDGNGCQATSTPTVVTVNALPSAPTISAGGATTFCSGGSVTLTSSQGSGNLWSTSASTAAINVTSAGSYSVTYTDGNGCQATSTPTVVTVNALPSTPTISAGGATTFCSGGSVTLTSSQGSNNTWSTSASTPAINVTSSGSYSVTYTDGNGCQATSTPTVVTVNALPATPTISAGGATTFCSGGSVTLTSSQGSGNLWSTSASTAAINVTSTGSYSVTYTDGNGCQATSTPTVVIVNALPSTPTISAGGATTFCSGGSVTLTSSQGSNNTWSTSASTPAINVTSSGSYSVTYTDGNGCQATSAATMVTVNPNPVIASGTLVNPNACATQTGSIEITGSGIGDISWTGASSGNANGATLPYTINTLGAGSYNVTIVDANGCNSNTVFETLTDPTPPASPMVTAGGATTFCIGGSVTLTSSETSGNEWSTSSTANAINVTSSGTYTVTFTDGFGCSATSAPIVVTVNANPAAPIVTPSGSTTFCDGGSVTLSSSETSGNEWSTSSTANAINVTSTGSYSVTYTDGNGCQATSTPVAVTVNALPATPVITAGGATTFCDGGSVTLTSSETSGNEWSNSSTANAINVTSAGSYNVTYTDGNGCEATSTPTVVTVNAIPSLVTGTISDPSACGTATGSIEVTGTGTADLSWTGTASGSANGVSLPYVISGLTAGSYNLTLTQNGCASGVVNQAITDPNPPTAPVISVGGATTFCDGGSVTLTSSYGTDNTWSTLETVSSILVTTSGTYSVTYTDGSGCSAASAPVVVTVNPTPNAPTISSTGSTVCEGETVTLTSSETSGNDWSTTESSQSIDVTTSGTYTVTYTDGNGCESTTASEVVTVNSLPTVSISTFEPVCLQDASFTLSQGSPSGGTYSGTGVSGTTFDPAAAGVGSHNITYEYTDGNGCSATDVVALVVNDCAGVNSLEVNGVKIYPNPATDKIYIERSNAEEAAEIIVTDASGRIVAQMVVNENPIAIDISNWPTGVYNVRLKVGESVVLDKIIVE